MKLKTAIFGLVCLYSTHCLPSAGSSNNGDSSAAAALLFAGAGSSSNGGASLAKPANVQISAGSKQISLTWDAVAGATSYTVHYGTTTALGASVTGLTSTSVTVVSLADFQTYYAAVQAVGGSAAGGLSDQVSARPSRTLKIFGTQSTFNGNLGGCAGANASCNSDANKPGGGSTYKAMLDGCSGVLQTSAQYVRTDGTTVIAATSDSGALPSTLTNAILASASHEFFTGHSGKNCSNYTDGSSGGAVGVGSATSTTAWWNTGGDEFCNMTFSVPNRLYCVEQP